jgi:hypothetical protein
MITDGELRRSIREGPEMDHFTSVDTLEASNFLRADIQPDLSATIHFVMPITGFENNGQPVMPAGFDKEYGLFLTLDGTDIANPNGSLNHFTSLNATLWADPLNDAGTISVSETSNPTFSNPQMADDIKLATGTFVSGSMSLDPTTGIRHADLVESMTPTLAGELFLDGSIKPGTLLEEKTTTLPGVFNQYDEPGGGIVTTVSGGTAEITLDPQATILVPNITLDDLLLHHRPGFISV